MAPFHTRLQRLKIPLLTLATSFAVLYALALAHDLRDPAPAPLERGQLYCAVPTDDAPSLLTNASRDHFQCIADHVDPWLDAYPDAAAHLDDIYQAYTLGRSHDLRGSSAAELFVEHHPTRFHTQTLTLTADQIDAHKPSLQGPPAQIPGEFQRFFIDRAQQRLFLTSQTEGLVSLSIAERYQFDVEGAMHRESGREFFVYNDQYAFLEEHRDPKTGRDLVVLDISDPQAPTEVHRLPAILPQAPLTQSFFPELTPIPAYPPTFEHYRQIQEGKALIEACGKPPILKTDPRLHCHPDGSCYRFEPRHEPADLTCLTALPSTSDFTPIAPLSYQITERAHALWSALPITETLLLTLGLTAFLLFGLTALLILFSPLFYLRSKRHDQTIDAQKQKVSALSHWGLAIIPLILLSTAGMAFIITILRESFYIHSSAEFVAYLLLFLLTPALAAAFLLFLASPLFHRFPCLKKYLPSAIRSAPGSWFALFTSLLLVPILTITLVEFTHSSPVDGLFIDAQDELSTLEFRPVSLSAPPGSPSPSPKSPSPRLAPSPEFARPSPSLDQEEEQQQNSLPRGGQGGAGSLSQMMVAGHTLYVLSARHDQPSGYLSTFDVSSPERPTLQHVLPLDNGPEALQRHDNLLLIAGRDALITASIAMPHAPRLLGQFQQECPVNRDPVVVHGSFAYRTLIVDPGSPLSRCRTSQLQTIDLSQPHQPRLTHTHNLQRPRGLAILHGRLFVADEHEGIHVFSLQNLRQPRQLTTWPLPRVNDLIISDFDLYALTPNEIKTFYIAPLYHQDFHHDDPAPRIRGTTTVRQAR